MRRQIHKRLTLQEVLLDRTAPEHGESPQNKQERKSSNSTQETTPILELTVDWVQNKHRGKESSSTLRYQWKGKEKERKKNFQSFSVFKAWKDHNTPWSGLQPRSPFPRQCWSSGKRIYFYIKTSKEFTISASSYFHGCVKTILHILSELLLCVAKWEYT